MARAQLVLAFDTDRAKAHRWVDSAPVNTRLEFKAPKRTIPQNDRMWAMLTDIAAQVQWHGLTLTTEDWKLIFLDGLKREMRIVPNLDGTGFVSLSGRSSSDLSRQEMSDLIELMFMFGAGRGVRFQDPAEAAA